MILFPLFFSFIFCTCFCFKWLNDVYENGIHTPGGVNPLCGEWLMLSLSLKYVVIFTFFLCNKILKSCCDTTVQNPALYMPICCGIRTLLNMLWLQKAVKYTSDHGRWNKKIECFLNVISQIKEALSTTVEVKLGTWKVNPHEKFSAQ